MINNSLDIHNVLSISPVIPVVVLPPEVDAVKLAQALVAGGIGVIEITLRTPNAIDCIASIVEEVSDICVGAGTVWNSDEAEKVVAAGAQFIVSPSFVKSVFEVCEKHGIPYLPGVATVGEAAECKSSGLTAVKVFPANIVGGPSAIKAFASVLPQLTYCPTGGVNLDSAPEYLALDNIVCVGGSWIIEKETILAGDWESVQKTARKTLQKLC